jgi:tetratricopeptide (TPR) repeat protein
MKDIKSNKEFYYHYSSAIDFIKEFNDNEIYNKDNIFYAYEHLKRAVEIEPEYSDTYVYLSYCMYLCEKDEASKYYLSKAIEMKTSNKIAIHLKSVFDNKNLKI